MISEPHVLSSAARSLWAKSDRGAGERWLPLFVHLCDTAAMGERLWDRWLSQGTMEAVAIAFEGDAELARTVTIFLGNYSRSATTRRVSSRLTSCLRGRRAAKARIVPPRFRSIGG